MSGGGWSIKHEKFILYLRYNSELLVYKVLKKFKFYRKRTIDKIVSSDEFKKCSVAGRVEIANLLYDEGFIMSPEEYVDFLNR